MIRLFRSFSAFYGIFYRYVQTAILLPRYLKCNHLNIEYVLLDCCIIVKLKKRLQNFEEDYTKYLST